MNKNIKRIAINIGGGYIPGINNVIAGTVLHANKFGWEVYGIHDGFEGLLFPERYPNGGIVKFTKDVAGRVKDSPLLSNAVSSDPFNVRKVNQDGIIEEVDRSEELLESFKKHEIDAVISVIEGRALSILLKLNRMGLKSVCIPKSIENDVWGSTLSFGFNSALNFTTKILESVRQAAASSHKIGVVEVPGKNAGWLALQSGMATLADAILIPELPYDLNEVALRLNEKIKNGQRHGLVVIAEGAVPSGSVISDEERKISSFNASLSPFAKEGEGMFIIERSGQAANNVALELQRLTELEVYPLVLNQLVRGGEATAVDIQLGLGYGAGAISALENNQSGVMIVYQPPELSYVPLAQAINKVRKVPTSSLFMKMTQGLDISLGTEVQL